MAELIRLLQKDHKLLKAMGGHPFLMKTLKFFTTLMLLFSISIQSFAEEGHLKEILSLFKGQRPVNPLSSSLSQGIHAFLSFQSCKKIEEEVGRKWCQTFHALKKSSKNQHQPYRQIYYSSMTDPKLCQNEKEFTPEQILHCSLLARAYETVKNDPDSYPLFNKMPVVGDNVLTGNKEVTKEIEIDIEEDRLESDYGGDQQNCATQCCHPPTLAKMFNPLSVFWPITKRKLAHWSLYITIAAIIATLESTVGFSSHLKTAFSVDNPYLDGVIFGVEPLLLIFNTLMAKYGPADKAHEDKGTQGKDVAVIIPCHNSLHNIGETIRSCLRHVSPEQIHIMDNGNTPLPADKTMELVKSIDPKIHYSWTPLGNKSFAQWKATQIVDPKYSKFLILDDDVHIPENFPMLSDKITGNIKGVCYPIKALNRYGKKSLLTDWQTIEYELSGQQKLVESQFCGTLYPHGAISLWDRETLKTVLEKHDLEFRAEDTKLGIILQQMGGKLHMHNGSTVETLAPTSVFGETPNYYQQRVESWELARHFYFGLFLKNLFTTHADSVSGTVIQKMSQVNGVLSTMNDYIKPLIYVFNATSPQFWIKLAALNATHVGVMLLWNYLKLRKRKDLQNGLAPILTYPLYKLMHSTLSVLSILRNMFFFSPNYVARDTIPEMLKKEPPLPWIKRELDPPPISEPLSEPLTEEEEKKVLEFIITSQKESPVADTGISRYTEPPSAHPERY